MSFNKQLRSVKRLFFGCFLKTWNTGELAPPVAGPCNCSSLTRKVHSFSVWVCVWVCVWGCGEGNVCVCACVWVDVRARV